MVLFGTQRDGRRTRFFEPGLKRSDRWVDFEDMATTEISCPVCSADIPLAGDEHSGEQIFCSACGAPSVLKGEPGAAGFEVEEDF